MVHFRTRLFVLCILSILPIAHSAVIYSGVQNLGVPVNPDGLYLNIYNGATAAVQPGSWNSAPWINPFFGGTIVATDDLLLPLITGTDQIFNLAAGTLIDSTSNFALAESGSSTHFGAGAGLFQLNTPGFVGFAFKQSIGGPTYYGWLQLSINNVAPGTIVDWAYEDAAGIGILAGATISVPEPSRALILFIGLAGVFLRRKR